MEPVIAEGFFKAILEKYAEPIATKVKDFSIDKWNEFTIKFDFAFVEYIKKAYTKYSKIKTVLYKSEPKDLYTFFEPPYLQFQQTKKIKTENIKDILDLSHFIIIQGIGGIGKSMLMKHLFLNEIKQKELIPIFIELKEVNLLSSWKLNEIIQNKLEEFGYNLEKQYLDCALRAGKFLFLLDGCDEIASEKKADFLRELGSFCNKYENNYYIVSSRPYSEFIEFQRFTVLEVCPFTKNQALSLMRKIEFDSEIKDKFIDALDKELYEWHRSFASNPLLLTIMLLTFENYAEIPEKLHIFYENAFDTMCFRHDANKGFKREWKSGLALDVFKRVFSEFCILTYKKLKIALPYSELEDTLAKILAHHKLMDTRVGNFIDDLTNAICVLCKDGLFYRFTHRSFQEYFTAIFLSQLSDAQMSEFGLKLIQSDCDRALFDSVFDMLYDMNPSRFEKNILLPILDIYENKCKQKDKFEFYFSELYTTVFFRFTYEAEVPVGCSRGISVGINLIGFVEKYMNYYYDSLPFDKEAENEILNYLLSKTPPLEVHNVISMQKEQLKEIRISSQELQTDDIAYNLLKKTWLGRQVENLYNLHALLLKRHREEDEDFAKLFE